VLTSYDARHPRSSTGDRFQYYSHRVRQLKWGDIRSSTGETLALDGQISAAWQRQQLSLFPALSHLVFDWAMMPNIARVALLLRRMHPGATHPTTMLSHSQADFLHTVKAADVASIATPYSGLEEVEFSISAPERYMPSSTGVWSHHMCILIQGSRKLRAVVGLRYLTPAALRHLASCSSLRIMSVDSLAPNGIAPALPNKSFAQLEILIIHSEARQPRLIHACLPLAMPVLRSVTLRGLSVIAQRGWSKILVHLSAHPSITSLTVDMWDPDAELMEPYPFILPLTSVVSLQHISLRSSFWSLFNELDYLHLLRCWPHIRRLGFAGRVCDDISLETFMRLLACCPHLEFVPMNIVCSTLPEESLVSEVAKLAHPFSERLVILAIDEVEKLAEVLRRSVPSVKEVYVVLESGNRTEVDDQSSNHQRPWQLLHLQSNFS
jgi:hypothetical protein